MCRRPSHEAETPTGRWSKIYRTADVFVLSSRAEDVLQTEATASESRVGCSDLEQVAAVVGERGSLCPVGDIAAIADGSGPSFSATSTATGECEPYE